ncbi:MAG: hypothetical protein ACRD2U_14210 [Terriglobales bacterium]
MSTIQSTAVPPAREQTAASSQARVQHSAVQTSVATKSEARSSSPKAAGYGLPCAKCKTYYAANLNACPVCKATERVSATSAIRPNAVASGEIAPDPELLEEERERFLREFQSQAYAASLQLGPAAASHCTHQENHRGASEVATVCQACYDQLQERVDVLEAVLHMDVKEAAEVIYDAVWSDPSDPSKTYQNAAQAMLTELKKRSGITPVFGPLQPLQH